MKNKRGFTLVEVLGVIVILLLLALIITPIVTSNLKKAHKDAKSVQEYTLKEAAKSWMSAKENISLMPVVENDCIEVTLRELKQGGYVDNDIKDPETNELLDDDTTMIIRKVGNDLTYEVNNGSQTCNVLVDSTYPRWTYVSSNKTIMSKNDTVTIKIKSSSDIKEYSLTNSDVTVKTNGQIVDDAIISNISCTGTSEITCEITITNINKDGKLNLEIAKDTLTSNENIKSKITPVLTDVIVDNEGPRITYVGRENNNSSLIYVKSTNTVVVIFDTLDSNITTDTIQTSGVDVYVNGVVNNNVTKSLTRTSVTDGYRYRLSLGNITGNGLLTVKIKKDQVSDTIGSKNKETMLNPGITVDNTLPEITFSVDGTSGYVKNASSTITATDLNGIKDPVEYTWSTDSTKTTYDKSGDNGVTATLNNVTGNYYLIAKACDLAGNCTRKVSNTFKFSNAGPSITFTPNGNNGYETSKTVRVSVTSGGADLDAGSLKYVISTSSTATPTREFTNNSDIILNKISGTYYLIAEACDTLGNCTKKVSSTFSMDGERPKIVYVGKTNTNRTAGTSAEYTTKSDTVTITLDGTDNFAYNDNLQPEDITVRANGAVVSATVTISKSNITKGKRYVITLTNITGNGALTISLDNSKITDNAGNKIAVGILSPGITIDNDAPTTPNCSAPSVSGSSTSATGTTASGSTDNYTAAANLKYFYLINNNGSTPANTNGGFKSSNAFTRACGTSYYEYAISEDEAGNRSAVKLCGSTSDGANSYSAWGACNSKCGPGTQYRTNSCALVTTGLSQSCVSTSYVADLINGSYNASLVTYNAAVSSYGASTAGSSSYTASCSDRPCEYHASGWSGSCPSDCSSNCVVYNDNSGGWECNKMGSCHSCSCPNGGSESGGTCYVTNYTCNAGDSLSGSTCYHYTCPNGGTLNGTTCSYYTCPNGGTLKGTICEVLTCPAGGTRNGDKCIVACSYAASVSTYAGTAKCSGGRTLSGGNCTYYYSSNASMCGTHNEDCNCSCSRWVCIDYGKCHAYDPSGNGQCINWDANWCNCNACYESSCSSCPVANSCTKTENNYRYYTCNSGDEVNGSTCYHYTCPNGGSLNTSNHMCEYN